MKQLVKNKYANYYVSAADEKGLKYSILNDKIGLVRIYNDSKELTISANVLGINNQLGSSLSDNKAKTSILLQEANIPVPSFKVFHNAQDATEYMLFHTKNNERLVIKPMNGSLSIGITIDPIGSMQIQKAVKEAFETDASVIVERYVKGKHYRITVLDDEIIAITQRLAAYVTGNGQSTLTQLIEQKNIDRQEFQLPQIVLREKDTNYLAKENIYLSKIYPVGNEIILQLGCNLDIGGERVQIDRDLVPQVNKDMFKKAAKTIKLRFCGLDYISPDIMKPYTEIATAINEINSAPDSDVHYRDAHPYSNYAAKRIIDKFFF